MQTIFSRTAPLPLGYCSTRQTRGHLTLAYAAFTDRQTDRQTEQTHRQTEQTGRVDRQSLGPNYMVIPGVRERVL